MKSIKKLAFEISAVSFEQNTMQQAKALKKMQKTEIDIADISPTVVQKVVRKLENKGYATYTSSGTLAIQRTT